MGESLFERHGRGVRPTAAGRVFARHAVGLLQSLEQMGSELADLRQGIAQHVRLCASTAAINQFLPPLLARYAKQHAQVRVDLDEQVSTGVVAALREGRRRTWAYSSRAPRPRAWIAACSGTTS